LDFLKIQPSGFIPKLNFGGNQTKVMTNG